MKHVKLFIAGLFALVLLPALTGTVQAAPNPKKVLIKMDKDMDGRISRSEWRGPGQLVCS